MQLKRAEEIISSPDKIDVFYRNDSVWIEGIDPNKDNADITLLDTRARMSVPIWDLDERM